MKGTPRIKRLDPPAGLPGAEVLLECEGLELNFDTEFEVRFDEVAAHLVGTAARRVLALVPEGVEGEDVAVDFVCDGRPSVPGTFNVAEKLADDLHPVANPAISPETGALYVTRSGTRGQQLPVTIFQIDEYGELREYSGDVLNPTGIAFDATGQMYVSSRAEGTVYRVKEYAAIPFVRDLGIATGLAFDQAGNLYVGDRTGTIYRVNALGEATAWAELEPSVAAYHLAFGPDDGALYVTGPTVCSNDAVMRISSAGTVEKFCDGFLRPQGLAFDREGNLYVVACHKTRRGIWRIKPDGATIELVVSGNNLVGLCFNSDGEMIAATTDAVYRLPLGIYGTLVDAARV